MKKFEFDSIQDVYSIAPDIKLSPDKKHLVYTAAKPCKEEDTVKTSLYVVDIENEKEFRLTSGEHDGGAVWLDDSRVLFGGARGGDPKKETKVFCIDINGGEATEYMTIPQPGAQITPLGGDRFLVMAQTDANKEEEKKTDKWVFCTEFPFKADGKGYVSKLRDSLFIFDKASGECKQITPKLFQTEPIMIGGFIVDEKGFYYCGWEYESDNGDMNSLNRYDFESGESKKLCEFMGNTFAAVVKDGRIWFTYNTTESIEHTGAVVIASVSVDGGDMREELVPDWVCYGISCAEGRCLVARKVEGRSELAEWKGGCEFETVPTGGVEPMVPVILGKDVLLFGNEPDRTQEFYILRDGAVRKLSHINDRLFEEYEFSKCEYLETVYQDHRVCGWVIKPVGYEPGKKYPGILSIHGGPHASYDDSFNPQFAVWAAQGYFVFFCNPRGSTSYGMDFQQVSGDFVQPAFEDIMAFTDAVVAKYGDLDPEKLVATGYSYGGIMSNWIITHTDRFKAVVSRASACDWISMRATSDLRIYCDNVMGADYNSDLMKVWNQCALKYVDNVKTPTLFIQQDQDYRCPLEQAEQMYCALNLRGVPTKLLVNFGGSHGKRSVQQQIHDLEVMVAWFDTYVK